MAKVWKVPSRVRCAHLPIPTEVYQEREFYTLYQKTGKVWKRCRTNTYLAAEACKVFGDKVLANPLMYSIRLANPNTPQANSVGYNYFSRSQFGG